MTAWGCGGCNGKPSNSAGSGWVDVALSQNSLGEYRAEDRTAHAEYRP